MGSNWYDLEADIQGSVWSRLGSEVTVVEYMPAIGAGMDADLACVSFLIHSLVPEKSFKRR